MKHQIATFLLIASCTKPTSVVLTIDAKTPQGAAIIGADVLLDDKRIGDTNAFGTFQKTFSSRQGENHKIELIKQSESYYFAPFIANIVLPKEDQFNWAIKASMFLAPKSTVSKSETDISRITSDPPPSPDSQQDANNTDSSLDSSMYFLRSDPEKINIDLSAELNIDPTTPLNEPEMESSFTVHVFSDQTPLANVNVYACADGSKMRQVCSTNSRGRCMPSLTNSEVNSEALSLIVIGRGYRTERIDGPFRPSSNTRFNMTRGATRDLSVGLHVFGKDQALANAKISTSEDIPSYTTNQCGFASLDLKTTSSHSETIKVVHESIKGGFQNITLSPASGEVAKIALEPSKTPPVKISVSNILPGIGLTQPEAIKYLTSENQDNISSLLVKTIKENFHFLAHNFREQIDGHSTHKLKLYVGHTENKGAELIGDLVDQSDQVVGTIMSPLGTTKAELATTINSFAESLARVIQSRSLSEGKKPEHQANSRWVNLETTPKYESVHWNDNTTQVGFINSPIDLGTSLQFEISPPPGYIGASVSLGGKSWYDLTGPNKIVLLRDYMTQIKDLISNKKNEEALRLISEISTSHVQYWDSRIAAAIIHSNAGIPDRLVLKEIIQIGSKADDVATRVNAAIAANQLAELPTTSKEEKMNLGKNVLEILNPFLAEDSKDTMLDYRLVAAVQSAIAKRVVSSISEDAQMAAESEAELKHSLKVLSSMKSQEKRRLVEIAASKNIRALTIKE